MGKKGLAGLLTALFIAQSASATALDASLSGMFANITAPASVSDNLRGSFIGGGAYIRTPNSSINPITIDAPHITAGCGGISATLGGFSYISSAKLMDFFRKIIQQAVPVAFQLALTQMFPQIAKLLNDFNSMAQRISSLSANSCQLATGIAHTLIDPLSSTTNQVNNSGAQAGASEGSCSDAMGCLDTLTTNAGTYMSNLFGSGRPTDATGTPTATLDPNVGNITWKALVNKQNTLGFDFGLDSDPNLSSEIIMSMVGTTIVGPGDINNPGSTTTPPNLAEYADGSALRFRDLIETSSSHTITVLVCNDFIDCLSPSPQPQTYYGIEGYVRTQLYGSPTGNTIQPGSILDKMSSVLNCTTMNCFTPTQQQFLNSASQIPTLAYLKKSQHSQNFLVSTTESLINLIVADAAVQYGQYIEKTIKSVWMATKVKLPTHYNENMKNLSDDIRDERKKRDTLTKDLGATIDAIEKLYQSAPELQGWKRSAGVNSRAK